MNSTNKNNQDYRLSIITWIIGFVFAACLSIAILLLSYILFNETVITLNSEKQITLPDNSEIQLKPYSILSYNTMMWLFSKDVQLSGEAEFNINTGKEFTVKTPAAKISTPGSQFKVAQWGNKLEVECYSNFACITTEDGMMILTENQKGIYKGGKIVKEQLSTLFMGVRINDMLCTNL